MCDGCRDAIEVDHSHTARSKMVYHMVVLLSVAGVAVVGVIFEVAEGSC